MDDALQEMAKTLPGVAFLTMLGVVIVLARALWRVMRVNAQTNEKLIQQNSRMLEFMQAILGGKRWRKADSDEVEDKRR